MNIVFITLDTQRQDRLGCGGYWRQDISPRIDRIAAEGVMFNHHYAAGIPTGAGFSSIHTGLFPIHHRFYLTPWGEPNVVNFDDTVPTMGDFFFERGYATAGVDNLINFGAHMKQFARGYQTYMNCTRTSAGLHHHVLADQVNDMAIPWLRANAKEAPFFLWIHYWDPHTPYNHPEEYRGLYKHEKYSTDDLHKVPTRAGYDYVPGWGAAHCIDEGDAYMKKSGLDLSHDLYDEEIRYVDDRVGQVYDTLAEMGVLDDTALVITSDHGEELGQHHEYWLHKYLYESTIWLPLIIRYPRALPQGATVDGIVQQVDLLPTLLDLAGVLDAGDEFDGASLLPMIRGEAPGRPFAFCEGGANWQYSRCLVADGWKYIWHANKDLVELYNILDDPAEIIDRSKDDPGRRVAMQTRLDALVADMLAGRPDPIPKAGSEFTWPLQHFLQISGEAARP